MDYKALLKKYMTHVGECEGVHFIPKASFMPTRLSEDFNKSEIEELRKISDEIVISIAHGYAAPKEK